MLRFKKNTVKLQGYIHFTYVRMYLHKKPQEYRCFSRIYFWCFSFEKEERTMVLRKSMKLFANNNLNKKKSYRVCLSFKYI